MNIIYIYYEYYIYIYLALTVYNNNIEYSLYI